MCIGIDMNLIHGFTQKNLVNKNTDGQFNFSQEHLEYLLQVGYGTAHPGCWVCKTLWRIGPEEVRQLLEMKGNIGITN